MDRSILESALDCLKELTPLKTDCGAYCDKACCKDSGEAGSGVWLLPGEDCKDYNWANVSDTVMPVTNQSVKAIYCLSPCERDTRPFLCRIFPLTPYYSNRKGDWSVRMDRRAAPICPLFAYGKTGLSTDFVAAAEKAVRILAKDEDYLKILRFLEQEESAYRMEL